MSQQNSPTHLRAMPILQVRDMAASSAFYARLGFEAVGTWDGFSIVQRGHVTLGLGLSDTPPDTSAWTSAYIYVVDIDAIFAEFIANNISIDREVMDQFYGCRDFELSDPDGHRLVFGQDMNTARLSGLAVDGG